jgi:hypothetical protein
MVCVREQIRVMRIIRCHGEMNQSSEALAWKEVGKFGRDRTCLSSDFIVKLRTERPGMENNSQFIVVLQGRRVLHALVHSSLHVPKGTIGSRRTVCGYYCRYGG